MEVYRYFKEKGAKISNPAEDFTGERGCFLYGKRESNERKYTNVRDHVLSIGLHGGVISELWLDIQHKLDGIDWRSSGSSDFGQTVGSAFFAKVPYFSCFDRHRTDNVIQ